VSKFPRVSKGLQAVLTPQNIAELRTWCSVEMPSLRCPSSEGTQGPKARLIREGQNLKF